MPLFCMLVGQVPQRRHSRRPSQGLAPLLVDPPHPVRVPRSVLRPRRGHPEGSLRLCEGVDSAGVVQDYGVHDALLRRFESLP